MDFPKKLGFGTAERRPSFLAPTVAMLAHMKDVATRKDKNERGFSFSRPRGPVNEYYADGNITSPRGNRILLE